MNELGKLVKDIGLVLVGSKHILEVELMMVDFVVLFGDFQLESRFANDFDDVVEIFVTGSDPAANSNVSPHLLDLVVEFFLHDENFFLVFSDVLLLLLQMLHFVFKFLCFLLQIYALFLVKYLMIYNLLILVVQFIQCSFFHFVLLFFSSKIPEKLVFGVLTSLYLP